MIKDIRSITDKCQKCGKEFELGENGEYITYKYVCLKCADIKQKKPIIIKKQEKPVQIKEDKKKREILIKKLTRKRKTNKSE